MHSNHLCPSLSIQYFYLHTMPSLQRGRWLPGKRLPWQLLGKRNICVPSRCAKSKMQIQRRRRGNWILEALVGQRKSPSTGGFVEIVVSGWVSTNVFGKLSKYILMQWRRHTSGFTLGKVGHRTCDSHPYLHHNHATPCMANDL